MPDTESHSSKTSTSPVRRFRDRTEAGALLAKRILEAKIPHPLLFALPRGGVPVGYEIARRLGCPLEALIVRKLGAPDNPEYAIGAIAEDGIYQLNTQAIERLAISEFEVDAVLQYERDEISRRIKIYREGRPLPNVEGRTAIIVDDGIATGETARVACRFLRSAGAKQIIIAAPVCPAELRFDEADGVITMRRAKHFKSVSQFYVYFSQVSDVDVVRLLGRGRDFGKESPLISG